MSDPGKTQIYIAGSWESKARLANEAATINELSDFECISWWLTSEADKVGKGEGEEADPIHAMRCADMDEQGVIDCDILILDTFENTGRGGKDYEHGYAEALGKEVWIVGPYINIFQRKADRKFNTWAEVHYAIQQESADFGTDLDRD